LHAGFGKLHIRIKRRLDLQEALLRSAAAIICALPGLVVLAALGQTHLENTTARRQKIVKHLFFCDFHTQ
jgi:hypothetical protein